MRDKDTLIKGFEDMKTLYQYLYMDENHNVTIENCIGVKLRLTMNENGAILCQNMNYPDLPPTDWTEKMTVATVQSIVGQLGETPAEEFPKSFRNRWDELKSITAMNVSQNKLPLCISQITVEKNYPETHPEL